MRVITLPRVKYHQYYTGQEMRTFVGFLQSLVYKYDLIHGFAIAQPSTGVPTLASKKLRGKPTIVDWDDLWSGGFAEYHNIVIRTGIQMLEQTISRMADKVTVVSDLLFDRVKKLGIDIGKIHRIPNGANVDEIKLLDKKVARSKLHLNTNSPIILSLGHTYIKSLSILFESFHYLIDEIPDVKLLLVGRVTVPREARNLFHEISSNVILAGEQPFSRISYFLASADVLVLPMEDSPIDRARWPIRLGDYLASARPIISNAVGEVKRILETDKCGLTSPPDDAQRFSQKIAEVLMDQELGEELGKRARRIAEEKYAWSIIASELSKVYYLLSRS